MCWRPYRSASTRTRMRSPGSKAAQSATTTIPIVALLAGEIAAAEDFKDLRSIARAHLEKARSGDMAASNTWLHCYHPPLAFVGQAVTNSIANATCVGHQDAS